MGTETHKSKSRHFTDQTERGSTEGAGITDNVTSLISNALYGDKGSKLALKAVFMDSLLKLQKHKSINIVDYVELLFVLVSSIDTSRTLSLEEGKETPPQVPKSALIMHKGEPCLQVWSLPDASDSYVRKLTDLENAIFIRQQGKNNEESAD